MDFQLGPPQSRESRECPLRDAIPMVAHAVVCSVETGKYRKSEDISKFLSEGRLGLAQPGHPNYALRQIYDLLDSLNIINSPLAGVEIGRAHV